MTTGLLSRFRKKEVAKVESAKMKTELEQLCGDDKETFEALWHLMFLDPRKIRHSVKEAAEKAKNAVKAKNFSQARIWYDVAGGLALYEGDVDGVVEYFGESAKVSDIEYPILKNPQKAVTVAQEFYKKFLVAQTP